MGCKRKMLNLCVNNSKTIEKYAERRLRGHWSFLGPGSEKKRHGTHDGKTRWIFGIRRQRKCHRISKIPVIRHSDVPAPWREDNQEATEEERQEFTSTQAQTTLSCSYKWSSLSISSVFTEQWRI